MKKMVAMTNKKQLVERDRRGDQNRPQGKCQKVPQLSRFLTSAKKYHYVFANFLLNLHSLFEISNQIVTVYVYYNVFYEVFNFFYIKGLRCIYLLNKILVIDGLL